MFLLLGYEKKNEENFFFAILKVTEERSDPELDPDLDLLVRVTDPRIRTKMSWIPNTAFKLSALCLVSTLGPRGEVIVGSEGLIYLYLSDSYPAFFLPIATTSNKNF